MGQFKDFVDRFHAVTMYQLLTGYWIRERAEKLLVMQMIINREIKTSYSFLHFSKVEQAQRELGIYGNSNSALIRIPCNDESCC